MKKLLSLLLTIAMLFSALPVYVLAESDSITVYVSASSGHEFLKTAEDIPVVLLPVSLEGEEFYNLDDVFSELHEQYAPSECTYATEETQWGLGITRFWGDDSGNYGYRLNSAIAMSLSDPVANGDIIDVTIYESSSYFASFATFDLLSVEAEPGESISLTLSQAGFDSEWNEVLSPCPDATITLNGEETEFSTDENGIVTFYLEEEGTYLVSANKDETIGDETYTAITPPYCLVNVSEPQYLSVLHNIAQSYSNDSVADDGNMIWFLCDLAMYDEIYPERSISLSEETVQTCLDIIISDAKETDSASVMAKSILALRAAGFDPKNITSSDGETFNLVERLTNKIDANDTDIENVYALPYILLALQQADDYATTEQKNTLLQIVIDKKEEWQNDMWGVDAMAAMLIALSHFSEHEEIAPILTQTVTLMAQSQTENGGFGNAASNGLAIAGLSACGVDVLSLVQNECTPVDALMSYQTESEDGFLPDTNSFSTEQGFRGLVCWQYNTTFPERNTYDFSGYPENPAISTPDEVTEPETTPEPTQTPVPTETPEPTQTPAPMYSGGSGGFSKPTPTPSPTPSPENLEKEAILSRRNPNVKVPAIGNDKTFSDIATHKNRVQIEALAKRGIINGKTLETYCTEDTMTRAEFAALVTRSLGLFSDEITVFADVKTDDWYYSYVNTAYHFGIIKGVSDTEFNPNGTVSRQEAAVMISRAAVLCGLDVTTTEQTTQETLSTFFDNHNIASWAEKELAFCYQNRILTAESSVMNPQESVDRGKIASILYQLLEKSYLLEDVIPNE